MFCNQPVIPRLLFGSESYCEFFFTPSPEAAGKVPQSNRRINHSPFHHLRLKNFRTVAGSMWLCAEATHLMPYCQGVVKVFDSRQLCSKSHAHSSFGRRKHITCSSRDPFGICFLHIHGPALPVDRQHAAHDCHPHHADGAGHAHVESTKV